MITESAVDSIGITFLPKVYSRGVSGRSALLRKSIQSYRLPKTRYGWWHIVSQSPLAEHEYRQHIGCMSLWQRNCNLANKTIVRKIEQNVTNYLIKDIYIGCDNSDESTDLSHQIVQALDKYTHKIWLRVIAT